jgi:hypothetical protein
MLRHKNLGGLSDSEAWNTVYNETEVDGSTRLSKTFTSLEVLRHGIYSHTPCCGAAAIIKGFVSRIRYISICS